MMEEKENVYLEDLSTPQTAEADGKEGGTVLGKFKDVNALKEAYEALQAEFTRRSQRLRALEKEAENSKREGETPSKEEEKPATSLVEPDKIEPATPQYAAESVDLYDAVKNSEEVRLKIIGDYLSSLKTGCAPITKGNARSPGVSKQKIASLQDAGKIALTFFQGK
jgi:hypothetical protein